MRFFAVDADQRIGRVLQQLEHAGLGLLGALEQAVRAHERVDARAQLGVGVRLDEVVVGARREPFDDLLRSASASSAAGWRAALGARCARAQEPADLDPRHAGHHPVEHQHVGRRLARELLEHGRAVGEDLDVVLAARTRRARSASSGLSSTTQTYCRVLAKGTS